MQTSKKSAFLLITTLLLLSASSAESAGSPKLRCGWFYNPTPQNVSLVDRDGEWTISMQGGPQAEGDWPKFKASQWVKTNRSYGYGCACITLVANAESRAVSKIISATSKPLSACRDDPALPKPAP